MAKDTYLKTKNLPLVVLFIIWCLALYITFQASPSGFWSKLLTTFQQFRVKDGIVLIMSPILTIVFTGIISPENKARLVFWRWRHALPGHRVFSKLIKTDSRIDETQLKKKLGALPENPKSQNSLWYSLYKKYSDMLTVKEAHKNFLLARDLTSVSFLFALLGPWGFIFWGHRIDWIFFYFAVMFGHYLILVIVAQNHGKRFVCNVITEYLANANP